MIQPVVLAGISMERTSPTCSTTHTTDRSRDGSEQIVHTSLSDKLLQRAQYLISLRKRSMAAVMRRTSSSSMRSMCRVSRRAVRRPIPGRRESSPHRIIKQFRHLVIVWPLSGLLVLRNDSEVNRLSVPQSRQAPILCCRRQSLSLSNRRTTTAPPPSSPRAE